MEQIPLLKLPDIVTIACARNRLKKCGDRCYSFRCTIDQGPKFVGKRISISLGTRDLVLAEKIAAMTLECLRKGGFTCGDVKFSKPDDRFDGLALLDEVKALICEVDEDTGEMIKNVIEKCNG